MEQPESQPAASAAPSPTEQQPAATASGATSGMPFRFEDAFPTKPATPASQPEPADPDPAATDSIADPSRGSAPEQTPPDASKPDGQPASTDATPDPENPTTRGQSAHEKHEADKAKLRALVDAAIKERDDAVAEADRVKAEQAKANAAYDDAIGPEAEYQRLSQLNNLGETREFTAEDWTNLSRWTQTRIFRQPFERDGLAAGAEYAKAEITRFQSQVAAEVSEAYGLPGVDVAYLKSEGHYGKQLRHAYEAGAKAASTPRDERISQLEADLKVARTQASAAVRTPAMAGVSGEPSHNSRPVFDPKRSVSDNFELGFGRSNGNGRHR